MPQVRRQTLAVAAAFFAPLSRYITADVQGIAIWEVAPATRAYVRCG